MTGAPVTARSEVPQDDALDLTLRLVRHLFEMAFETEATRTWSAPGAVVLFGGSDDGPALALPTRWGAKVAGRTREDGTVRVGAVHRPNDHLLLDVATMQAGRLPQWAAAIPQLVASLLEPASGGAFLLAYMDVPDESGILAGAALHAALALALSDLGDRDVEPARLLAALGGDGILAAAHATSLLGRYGQALLLDAAGSSDPHHLPFDPAAASLRLVLMSARPGDEPVPLQRWNADPSDDARVDAAAGAIAGEDWDRLGMLLTEAHHAGAALREPAPGDLLVDCALAAGALGGRATSSTTAVALVPARSLQDLRSVAVRAFAEKRRPAPRFLATGALPPAGARPESLLGA